MGMTRMAVWLSWAGCRAEEVLVLVGGGQPPTSERMVSSEASPS